MKATVRYASLNRYIELSQNLGIDPVRLMRRVGLDPSGLTFQDTRIPATAVAQLLEDSASASGCDDFGVRLAELRQFSNLGPLSLVLREEPDVRSAIDLLIRYEHTYNDALRLRMSERDELATIGVRFDFGEDVPCRQSFGLAVGALRGILGEFLGAEWQPVSVCFAHGAPRDCTVHQRLFGLTPQFDQPFSGLVLYSTDLAASNRMSDPNLRTYAQQFLRSLGAPRDQTTMERVRELIHIFLPAGRCSLAQIARELHVDRRTLHRHLAEHGETFTSLLDEARAELAEHYLRNGRYSLTEISQLLGFSALSGFSRWFRTQYGCSASEWRARMAPVRGTDRRDKAGSPDLDSSRTARVEVARANRR
jgi:AraC-like DNA-binding protein